MFSKVFQRLSQNLISSQKHSKIYTISSALIGTVAVGKVSYDNAPFLITSILNKLEPETAHNIAIWALSKNINLPLTDGVYKSKSLESRVFGVDFQNPVGLAAGFDKNGVAYSALSEYGFGFIEIGSITPFRQNGNPKPRIFRDNETKTIINFCGLNNYGVVDIVERVMDNPKLHNQTKLGVSLSKNNDGTTKDYSTSALYVDHIDHCDYVVLNLSCPNVPNKVKLDQKKELEYIITSTQKVLDKPVLIKISPDITDEQLKDIAEISIKTKLDGIICSNTKKTPKGGMSGQTLLEKSNQQVAKLYKLLDGNTPIIGCGGVMSPQDAYLLIKNGASLIQIYSYFIFEGPECVNKINKKLDEYLIRDGFTSLADAVGSNL